MRIAQVTRQDSLALLLDTDEVLTALTFSSLKSKDSILTDETNKCWKIISTDLVISRQVSFKFLFKPKI